mgnify:FL=1
MYFKGSRVTLESISSLFRGYSLDIQDEVRSMVMDNLDLSKWIDVCKDNPYRLNQIRLGSKEGLDPRFFTILDGSVIYRIRSLEATGFNVGELLAYVGVGFTKEQWFYIISWAERGLLDSRLALVRTPFSMWGFIDKGLRNNLPMWLFTSGKKYSDTFMHSVLTLMSNGQPGEKFLNSLWKDETLKLLAEFSYRRWFNNIVGFVDYFIPYDFLVSVGELAKEGLIDEDLFEIGYDDDSGNYYLYQSYHLEAILRCVMQGYDYSKLKDYNLSGSEVDTILKEIELNSKRSFRGRL